MKKKYKLIVAFLLTLLLVLGAVPASFAEPKPDEEKTGGGTSIHLKDNSAEGIEGVTVYYTTGTEVILSKSNGNNWEALDDKQRVLSEITKIVVNFTDFGQKSYYYPNDFGKQGGKVTEPIEYSAEKEGSINLWLNKVLDAKPSIQLEKTVSPDFVSDKVVSVGYTFNIKNNGNVDLIYVVLDDVQLDLTIKIGDLKQGEKVTKHVVFDLSETGETDWINDTYTNIASVEGTYGDEVVTATDDAIVTYTENPITPGGIKIFKDVPNVSNSEVEFTFEIFDQWERPVTSGTASEVKPFVTENNLAPGKYLVEEEVSGELSGLYDTEEYSQEVMVPVDGYGEVTFVNTLRGGPTLGALEIKKNVPEVDNSGTQFTFSIYDGDELVTTGSATEVSSLLIEGLDPGTYTVIEDPVVGYNTVDDEQDVKVEAGSTALVTFTNHLINNPETSDPAIQVIKTVSPTQVSSRTATVTYTFNVSNPGDFDLYGVYLTDSAIGLYRPIGALEMGATTTASVTFDLALLGTTGYESWDGDTFVNNVTAIGYTREQEEVRGTDDATVTYSSGGGGGGNRHRTTTTTVVEEPTPAAPVETPVTPIIEEPVPAAPLPQTGGIPAALVFGIGSLLAGGGVLLRRKEK